MIDKSAVIISREQFTPLVFSLLVHAVFAAIFVVGFAVTADFTPSGAGEAEELIQARVVTAAELENAIRERDAELARERLAIAEQQRRERERIEAAQRQRERAAEAARLREEQRRQAEIERQREADRQQAAAERRARELAAERQAEREAELRSALEAEQQRQQAIQSGLLAEYVTTIKQKVARNWSPPPNLSDDVHCVVRVEQIPGGEVVSVRIRSCNGDDILVRSVEAAVWKASPLPTPPDASVFESTIDFTFCPGREVCN